MKAKGNGMKTFTRLAVTCLTLLLVTACNRSDEKITQFRGSLSTIVGPKEEIARLKAFPSQTYKICNIDGLGAFYIDSRPDLIKNELLSGRPWKPNINVIMKQLIQPETTAIDVGAHIGIHTLAMSSAVGDKGRVIAFEPQVKLYDELVMNMILNKRQNVVAYRCALGDQAATIEMCPPTEQNEGATPIGKGGDKAEMITLDSLKLTNVSFIKIGVENFEYEVLKGAEQTIRANHPYMVIEVMPNVNNPVPNWVQLVEKSLGFVEQMGYALQHIDGNDWVAIPVSPVAAQ